MEKIGIIGVGRLGICMALCFERAGFDVYCVDTNDDIMRSIEKRSICSHEPHVTEMLACAKNIHATTLEHLLDVCNTFFVVVPTPSLSNNEYDHTYIEEVVSQIKCQKDRKTMVISCTVMPEYCHHLADRMSKRGIDVCYNPEFIAQGDIVHGFENPDIVLIGAHDTDVANRIADVYKRVCKNSPSFCIMSLTEAEITKISLNCFVTMKIAYANMIGDLVRSANGDPQKVLDAISKDSRVGDKCMRYGYGYGGPCFPRDNLSLQKFAETKEIDMHLSKATDVANDYHMEYMFRQMQKDDNAVIVFDYVTYKPESIIIEQSFPLKLATKLAKAGQRVQINERACVIDLVKKQHGYMFEYKCEKLI